MRGKNSSNSHHFASICINFASFFHLVFPVLLLVVITILTGCANLLRHLSSFIIFLSTSCKKNSIHIHSPAQPSKIWHFTGSPRPHTLNFDVGFCSSTVSSCVQGFQLIHGANATGSSCISKRFAFFNH